MYKAVAEAVSGLKVFANGKWLTCIGNKPVRVGDRIWTDGRCVYGFNKEAQSPMVIISPQREDLAIPIMMLNRDSDEISYYTYTSGLQEIPKSENTSLTVMHSAHITHFMMNDPNGKVYAGQSSSIFAANCDSAGNFYTLELFGDYQVAVTKNKEIVQILKLLSLPNPSQAVLYSKGFIEDANNWAFTYTEISRDFTRSPLTAGIEMTDDNGRFFIAEYIDTRIVQYTTFLYSGGFKTELFNGYGMREYFGSLESGETKTLQNQKQEHFTAQNVRHPLPGGYYFQYNSLYPTAPDIVTEYQIAHITLFTPDGQSIFSGYFSLLLSIHIVKVGDKKYLIAIGRGENASVYLELIEFWGAPTVYYNAPEFIQPGLYLCENGIIKSLFELKQEMSAIGTPYTSSRYTCLNQSLQPMKNYKKWSDNIRVLTQSDIGVDKDEIHS